MNLAKLFETQRKLDERIIEEKGLQGQNLLDKKILALQVELGELANEWRGFKFWKEDPKPRYETVETYIHGYDGPGTNTRASIEEYRRTPILEEYVDCLHFILSIGNETALHHCQPISRFLEHQIEIELNDVTDQFLHLFMEISGTIRLDTYIRIWNLFHGLGKMLGFTPEQVESAYYEKNAENHRRQEVGY